MLPAGGGGAGLVKLGVHVVDRGVTVSESSNLSIGWIIGFR